MYLFANVEWLSICRDVPVDLFQYRIQGVKQPFNATEIDSRLRLLWRWERGMQQSNKIYPMLISIATGSLHQSHVRRIFLRHHRSQTVWKREVFINVNSNLIQYTILVDIK